MLLQTTPFSPNQEPAEDGHRWEENDLDIEKNAFLERVGSKGSDCEIFGREGNEIALFREPSDRTLKEIAVADEVATGDCPRAGERPRDTHLDGGRVSG